MRKVVLFIVCLGFVLLCPIQWEYAVTSGISTSKTFADFKQFFNHDSLDVNNDQANKDHEVQGVMSLLFDKLQQAFREPKEAPVLNTQPDDMKAGGHITTHEGDSGDREGALSTKIQLDLTLPTLVDEPLDLDINAFNESEKRVLPNLFTPTSIQKESSRTSFGGRLLMDENFDQLEEYRFQDIKNSIEGAELTFEVKTN